MNNKTVVPISGDDITVLWAAEAELHGKLKPPEDADETQGERPYLWVEGWHSRDDWFSWTVELGEPQDFQLAMTYSCDADAAGSELEIKVGASTVEFAAESTRGWIPDWGMEWSSFAKHSLAGSLQLGKGVSTIEFRARKKTGTGELPRLYTLELTPPTEVARLVGIAARARSGRACADWFVDAQYGLSFHWTAMSQLRRGEPKPFPQAVADFAVEPFADMVEEAGAGYVIFTSTHAPHFYPAPIEAIERILPGNTCERDLIGDLADALQCRRIPLILYYPGGRSSDDTPAIPWGQASGWNDDRESYFRNFCAIFAEIGERYGSKVAGYWFDFCPFNVSHRFEPLYAAAKTGNPNRIVAWNSWLNRKPSDFQDYWAGEVGEFLALPDPEHHGDLQPHVWFFLDDEWTHEEPDTDIPPPLYRTADLIDHIKAAGERRIPVSMNVGVYQDGTASKATMQQLLEIKKVIRRT